MNISTTKPEEFDYAYYDNRPEPAADKITLYYTQYDIDELTKQVKHYKDGWAAASKGIEVLTKEIERLQQICVNSNKV